MPSQRARKCVWKYGVLPACNFCAVFLENSDMLWIYFHSIHGKSGVSHFSWGKQISIWHWFIDWNWWTQTKWGTFKVSVAEPGMKKDFPESQWPIIVLKASLGQGLVTVPEVLISLQYLLVRYSFWDISDIFDYNWGIMYYWKKIQCFFCCCRNYYKYIIFDPLFCLNLI